MPPASITRTRRLWPRFTLRVTLVVMTLLSIGLAFWTQRARQQKRIADQIRLSGGRIVYDFEAENTSTWVASSFPFQDVTRNQFDFDFGDSSEVENESSDPRWLLLSLGEDFFHTIVRADVSDCDELRDIDSLWNLQELAVGRGVNDEDIKHVARLQRLNQLLVISDSKLTDDSLVLLATIPTLEIVHLEGDFSATGLIALAQSSSLRELTVNGCDDSVDQAVVDAFRRAGRVRSLWLQHETSDSLAFGAFSGHGSAFKSRPVLGYGN